MKDKNRSRIMALIPAYNEAAHIQAVVQGAVPHVPVLVVDDGSEDETPHLAEEAGARVIRQASNQGKGGALLAGFRQALADDQEAVITLDADGQHDTVVLLIDDGHRQIGKGIETVSHHKPAASP